MINLVKIGGSLITNKSVAYSANLKMIKQICKEISVLIGQGHKLIIGNGAGSFGHQSAKKYQTADGFVSEESKIGLGIVQYDAHNLHSFLVKEFIELKAEIFSLSPSSLLITKNSELKEDWFKIVQQTLDFKLTPFLYGDAVLDLAKGCGIVSTDTLFEWLAIWLAKKGEKVQIISAGNYDGVLDNQGKVISHISANQNLAGVFYDLTTTDVTGGMKTKVEGMQKLAKDFQISSVILNGGIKGRLSHAINGEPGIMTIIG